MGFFGRPDPVDRIAKRIAQGCSIEEVRECRCPTCCSVLEISFPRTGTSVCVSCAENSSHFRRIAEVKVLPSWWREHIGDRWFID